MLEIQIVFNLNSTTIFFHCSIIRGEFTDKLGMYTYTIGDMMCWEYLMLCYVISCYSNLHLTQINQHPVRQDSFWKTTTMLAVLYLLCYKCVYFYMRMGRNGYCIINKSWILNFLFVWIRISVRSSWVLIWDPCHYLNGLKTRGRFFKA